MPEPALKIELKGLDELNRALKKFPFQVKKNFIAAGRESAVRIILPTEGLLNYPPETGANTPPTPYYIRSRGTQTATKNYGESENLGKQWFVKRAGLGTRIYNRASYAKWVHGEEQAGAMDKIGWKKLYETAKEKISEIQKVYQRWVDKTLKEVKLK